MTDPVLVADDGAVRVIRMNRPEKKNALTRPMYVDLARALREADANGALRCVMLTGSPGAFTAGSDIGDFLKAAETGEFDPRILEFLDALARSQKPLIAAVDGLAIGIGATMLLHCDHVVASSDAKFSTPFLKLGLVPEAASSLLAPLRMGHARAFSLLAMGRPLSAAEAKDAGLVNSVVEAGAVEETARKAAQEIAALPPEAVAITRRLMRVPLDDVLARIDTEAMYFKERLQSEEARLAFAKFLARKN